MLQMFWHRFLQDFVQVFLFRVFRCLPECRYQIVGASHQIVPCRRGQDSEGASTQGCALPAWGGASRDDIAALASRRPDGSAAHAARRYTRAWERCSSHTTYRRGA